MTGADSTLPSLTGKGSRLLLVPPSLPWRWANGIAATMLVTAAYFAAAKLGMSLAVAHASISAIWAPTGIALAAVVLGGYRMLPAVALGAFLANVTTAVPLAAVLGITAGNTLESLVGALLLRRAGFDRALERMRDVVILVALAGVLSTIISATIGVASLAGFDGLPLSQAGAAWRTWWLGDMGGVMLVATALFVIASTPRPWLRSRAAAEALGLSVLLAGISVLVLSGRGPNGYAVFPILFLMALLYRQRGAVLGGLVISGIAIWFTTRGHGPFIGGLRDAELARAQTFVSIGTITALLVAAAKSERHDAEVALGKLAESERALERAAEALAYRADHDPLTGLPNRTVFLARLDHALARARRSNRSLAAMFLDLDDFKLVNDTRGHEVGDQLLVALTPKLTGALRPGDTIARFGGDEFVVLCEDLLEDSDADALQIASRIAHACSGPIVIDGHEHVVTVSTGVVLVSDFETATPSGILRDADSAMYRAKSRGKGRIEVFDEPMRARLVERLEVEAALRRAIERDELRLFYQPVMSIDDHRVVAMEALLRWQHPTRGLLAPAEFMNVAESTGLILEIGEWVIEEACHQAAMWREATGGLDPVRVSVNLSARQVIHSDLVGTVARILLETGLEPQLLELEITEAMLVGDAEACSRSLGGLKALGIRLVLDDFGTGYSSFAHLKQFAIDALKIDGSFIGALDRGSKGGTIIGAVLGMAEALDVSVTAEGVETATQLARLRAHGCEFAQGYLFSPPVPADEVAAVLHVATEREHVAA